MEGPFNLTAENIAKVRKEPGVYILGFRGADGKDYGCYVGRSDEDISGRLGAWFALLTGDHIPHNDSERCVLRRRPDRYWREYAQSANQAYERECAIYHEHGQGYECNDVHPAKSYQHWHCPICGL